MVRDIYHLSGHALVIKNPDIPYANWQYRQNGKKFSINNLKQRFIPASENIFKYIRDFLSRNEQYHHDDKIQWNIWLKFAKEEYI